jgi:hypothetical protein
MEVQTKFHHNGLKVIQIDREWGSVSKVGRFVLPYRKGFLSLRIDIKADLYSVFDTY